MSIRSFKDRATETFFKRGALKKGTKWASVKGIARRKLDMLEYAADLKDLLSPPGNKLEALSGDLRGCYSIGINDQFRVVFKWTPSGAAEVHICDYH